MPLVRRAAAAGGTLAAAAVLSACTGGSGSGTGPAAGTAGAAASGSGAGTSGGAFVLTDRPKEQVAKAGLALLPAEGMALHEHAHLDVEVNGDRIIVPAAIGIARTGISPLHTHDTTGVVHIEAVDANQAGTFRLDQVFTEWGVAFDGRCLATYCSDGTKELRVYVDGKRVADPMKVPIVGGQEIVVWFGAASADVKVPSTYDFGSV